MYHIDTAHHCPNSPTNSNLSFCCGKPISNFFSIPYLQSDFSRRGIQIRLKKFPRGGFSFSFICAIIYKILAQTAFAAGERSDRYAKNQ